MCVSLSNPNASQYVSFHILVCVTLPLPSGCAFPPPPHPGVHFSLLPLTFFHLLDVFHSLPTPSPPVGASKYPSPLPCLPPGWGQISTELPMCLSFPFLGMNWVCCPFSPPLCTLLLFCLLKQKHSFTHTYIERYSLLAYVSHPLYV